MASLVAEVLSSAGLLEKDSLAQEIKKLSRRIEIIKVEVQEALDNCYSAFCPLMVDSMKLREELECASKESTEIISKIQNELKPSLQDAALRSDGISQDIQRTNLMSSIISSLVEIHTGLEEVETARLAKKFLEASKKIGSVSLKIKEISFPDAENMKVLRSLKTEQILRREKLIHNLIEIWDQSLKWSLPLQENSNCCELVISFKDQLEKLEEIGEFLGALHTLNQLECKVKTFGQKIMKYFVKPIVTQSVELEIQQTLSSVRLIIKIENSSDKPNANLVCENIRQLFDVLSAFLNSEFVTAEVNQNNTLMYLMSKFVSQEFCQLLIKECLGPAVPNSSKDLDSFKNVMDSVVLLDTTLQECGFLICSDDSLIQYAKNHDSLFANKICQDILSKARAKMKNDLFITMEIALDSANTPNSEILKENDLNAGYIDEAMQFPSCKVSTFVEDILDILIETLKEATRNASISSTRLYLTARHVCEMFCDVVPVYHSNNIAMFPQQAAIHHNNCMYLAHRLLLLGTVFQSQLAPVTGDTSTITFVDLALKLRRLGTESFLEQMRKQRQQIYDFIQASGAFHDMSNETEFNEKAQKAVKQCLLHLSSLRNVWIGVLPDKVYLKTMGTLCNSCIEELILRVINQEDITEKATGHLNFLFQLVLNEMPSLFCDAGLTSLKLEDNGEGSVMCQKYIKRWQKFKELKILLVSNLKGIVDRWASGKGPLADDFAADEVKQLIRALFQNTDRRAQALANIR